MTMIFEAVLFDCDGVLVDSEPITMAVLRDMLALAGWDMPLAEQIRLAKKNNDRELFWNAHLLGSKKEYFHVEQLTNLAALPPFGFQVFLFPLKLRGASAAPLRAVAILND